MTVQSKRLNIKLFQGNTEDDMIGSALHGAGAEVEFIPQIQVEEDTSPSGVDVNARSSRAAVGVKLGLWDPLFILD